MHVTYKISVINTHTSYSQLRALVVLSSLSLLCTYIDIDVVNTGILLKFYSNGYGYGR